MRRQLVPALAVFLFFTVLVGVVYPLAVTGVARIAFPSKSQGSLVRQGDKVVGSRLIGQAFSGRRYFQPRPSAAGEGYDGAASAASNLGPTSKVLLADVGTRIAAYRRLNGLPWNTPVPVDAVTASGSGLDGQISPANARLQAPRIARFRGLALAQVLALVQKNTDGRALGFLGEPGVNVLELNLALDNRR
jgi:K+-transporting ATPase ATPase C chain